MDWKVWSAVKFAKSKELYNFRQEHGLTEAKFYELIKTSPLYYISSCAKVYARVHVLITNTEVEVPDLCDFYKEYMTSEPNDPKWDDVRGEFVIKCGNDLIAEVFKIRRSETDLLRASNSTATAIKNAARAAGFSKVPIGLTEEIYMFPNAATLQEFCVTNANLIPRPKKEFHVPA